MDRKIRHTEMLYSLQLYLVSLTLLQCIIPFPVIAAFTVAANSTLVLQNSSTFDNGYVGSKHGGIPLAFTTVPYLEPIRLNHVLVMMTTIYAILKLSLQDVDGTMGRVEWELKGYPEMGIVISPPIPGGSVERRFVIWGLARSASYMLNNDKYQAGLFKMYAGVVDVGSIKLVKLIRISGPNARRRSKISRMTQDLSLPSGPETLDTPASFTDISTALDFLDSMKASRFNINASQVAPTIPVNQTFELIFTVLAKAALMKPKTKIHDYNSPDSLQHLEITVLPPGGRLRPRPPYVNREWLIKSMAAIPEYMLRNGVFTQLLLMVTADEVRVADGSLGLKGMLHGGLSRLGGNVTSNLWVS